MIKQQGNACDWKEEKLQQERNQESRVRLVTAVNLQDEVADEGDEESHQRQREGQAGEEVLHGDDPPEVALLIGRDDERQEQHQRRGGASEPDHIGVGKDLEGKLFRCLVLVARDGETRREHHRRQQARARHPHIHQLLLTTLQRLFVLLCEELFRRLL